MFWKRVRVTSKDHAREVCVCVRMSQPPARKKQRLSGGGTSSSPAVKDKPTLVKTAVHQAKLQRATLKDRRAASGKLHINW